MHFLLLSHLLTHLIYNRTRIKLIMVYLIIIPSCYSIYALFEMQWNALVDKELWYLMSAQCLAQEITQSSELFCSRVLPVLDLIIFTTFLCMSCTTVWVYRCCRLIEVIDLNPDYTFLEFIAISRLYSHVRWWDVKWMKRKTGLGPSMTSHQSSFNALGHRFYTSLEVYKRINTVLGNSVVQCSLQNLPVFSWLEIWWLRRQ